MEDNNSNLNFLGNDSSFTNLTSDEKKYFIEVIKEEIRKREIDSKTKQIREIMPIERWVNSVYMLGKDVDNIYPYWKNFLIDIFRSDRTAENRINSVILSGSIGTGKSTVSELIMMRKLYELSCFKNVNAMFHLMSKTNIMMLYFSVNKTQAESTGFGELRALVDNSPYFREHFRRKERIDSLLVFPEGITVAYGSRSSDAIGMSVITALLDEANFIAGNGSNSSGNTEKALDMYAGIVNRANSRFIMEGGQNYSLNILVSSATHESSATERQIALSKGDPHTIVAAPSQWEVKPDKFSKKFFYVLKGTNYLEPQIVESTDDVNNFRLSEGLKKEKFVDGLEDFDSIEKEIKKLPPHHQERFLKVPVDLKRGFEMNIIRSLQDLGGVSTGSTGKLFNSPQVYDDCIDPRFHHPFVASEIVISTGDRIEIKDYLRSDFYFRHPERKRYIHIDQSTTTDSTGIACGYIEDVEEDETTGMKKPIIGIDFILRINPPKPPKKIAIYKIRNFVVFLGKTLGLRLGRVTYDIFNSEESRQILEEMGFNVAYQSVDRTDKAYLDLVEIMYEGRLKLYEYPILRHELFNLIHYRDKRKVDHPATVQGSDYTGKGSSIGSKDTSDALCLSADTKLFLLSGREMTIEELYNSDFSDEWVLSCDVEGKQILPVKIEDVIKKEHIPDKIYDIELDNGKHVKVTGDHLVLMRDGSYKKAKDMVVGDSLMPFVHGKELTWKNYYRTVKSPFGGKPRNIYKLVAHTVLKDKWDSVYEIAKNTEKDFVVTHHKNHNKLDDRPSNLEPMLNSKHRKLHADIFIAYNKSEKHAEDIRRAFRDGRNKGFKEMWKDEEFAKKIKKIGRDMLVKYNKSEKHGEDIRKAYRDGKYAKSIEAFRNMARDKDIHKRALETKRRNGTIDRYAKRVIDWNRDTEMKYKQQLGKVKYIHKLLVENTDVLKHDIVSVVDIHVGIKKLKEMGITGVYNAKYDASLWEKVGVNLYPITCRNRSGLHYEIEMVLEAGELFKLIKENIDGDWDRTTMRDIENAFNQLKSIGKLPKRYSFKKFKYEDFLLAHVNLYNHRVSSINVISNEDSVYDLKLGSIHNFGIDSGVFVHNCGVIESILKDTISESSGVNSNIDDFLAANRTHTYFEPDPMNADDMIDKMLEDMIDDMEMGNGGDGFGYF